MLVKRDMAELQALRDELLDGSWLQLDRSGRRRLIARFCEGYVVPPLAMHLPTTFRAQRNDDRQMFGNVARLMAPPADCVKLAGRLNKAGEPTLYLSSQPIAAIFETRAELGTMVSVLACRMRPDAAPLQLAPVAMDRLTGSKRIGPYSSINTEGPLGDRDVYAMLSSSGLVDQWRLQDQTLGEILVLDPAPADQQDLYDLTNGIRDHLYSDFDWYEGVRYPSIVTRLTAINIALDSCRWQDIEPLEVWVTEVSDEMFYRREGSTIVYTKPLLALGSIGTNGEIEYQSTDKSFLTALGDFKQRHGSIPAIEGMRPALVQPFTRFRISYGSDRSRPAFDFMPGDPAMTRAR